MPSRMERAGEGEGRPGESIVSIFTETAAVEAAVDVSVCEVVAAGDSRFRFAAPAFAAVAAVAVTAATVLLFGDAMATFDVAATEADEADVAANDEGSSRKPLMTMIHTIQSQR